MLESNTMRITLRESTKPMSKNFERNVRFYDWRCGVNILRKVKRTKSKLRNKWAGQTSWI